MFVVAVVVVAVAVVVLVVVVVVVVVVIVAVVVVVVFAVVVDVGVVVVVAVVVVVVVAEAAPAGQEDCRQNFHADVDAQLPKSVILMRIRLTIYNFTIGAQPYIYLLLPWARNRGDYFVKSHFQFLSMFPQLFSSL